MSADRSQYNIAWRKLDIARVKAARQERQANPPVTPGPALCEMAAGCHEPAKRAAGKLTCANHWPKVIG